MLFPHGTVGRHKAAKSKLPMSCTMVFFFFWFFVTYCLISLSSRPPRKALFQGDLWIFSTMHSFFLICERVLRHLKKGLLRGVRTKVCASAHVLNALPELSAARESNECSVARSFESWEGRNFWKFLKIWMLTRTFSFSFFFFRGVWCSSKEYEKKEKGRDAETHTHIYPILFVSR